MRGIAKRPARRGIMLVEILLALAITAIVAAGVASLLFAVANGTKERQEVRRRNVRVDVLADRIDRTIRSSGMVLARDNHSLVLWMADTTKNGMPNLSEIRRIEYSPSGKQIVCYRAPATLAPASNTVYDLATTNFLTTTASLRGSASFAGEVWGNNVTDWTTSPKIVTPATRLIAYGVTIKLTNGDTHTARSSAALRGSPGNAG
jgi:type II secretory pathway pseudopilin PulG